MVVDTALWPSNQSNALESVLIALTWVSWAAIIWALIQSRTSAAYLGYLGILVRINLVLLALAAIIISLLSIDPTINDWIVSASIFNLVVGVAGVSIRNPEQWLWVGGLVATELLIFIAFGLSFSGEMQFSSVVLYPLYALAIGVAAASAQNGLVKGAIRAEQAQALAIDREVQVQLVQESEKQTAATQTRIHETVLNTLTAISRGGLPATPETDRQISARCFEAAQVLKEILQPMSDQYTVSEPGLYGAITDLIAELESQGVSVSIFGNTGAEIPKPCEAPIIAAVREALINVRRHSHATRVSIRVTASPSHRYRVSIEDDGTGFAEIPKEDAAEQAVIGNDYRRIGYGWGTILGSDLHSCGARAWVETWPMDGSIVHIEFAHPRKWLDRLVRHDSRPTQVFVLPILASWMCFSAVNVALVWNEYSSPLFNVLSFLLVIAFSILAVGYSRFGSLPWWMVFVGVVVALISYEGEKISRGLPSGDLWSEWSSEAIAAIFMVLAAASTWWAWMVVGVVWLIIQENFPQELIAPGFIFIMLGGVLGLVFRRSQHDMQSSLASAAREGVNVSMARYQLQSRIEKFSHLNAADAIHLLDGIAEGQLDWRNAEIRHQCAVQEMYVRNVVISGLVASNRLTLRVAELARRHEAVVEIIKPDSVIESDYENDVIEFLEESFGHMAVNDFARFSIVPELNYVHYQLVCHFSTDVSSWIRSYQGSGEASIEIDRDAGGTCTVVWHLQREVP